MNNNGKRTNNPVTNFQNRYDSEGNEQDFRIPPNNISAEQSVLGGLMLSTEKFDEVQGIIQESDFFRRDHQIIFRALQRIHGEGNPIDIITASDFLQKHNTLESVGGLAYIGLLAKNTPSAANIITYAEIVKESSQARKMLAAGASLGNAVFENDGVPLEQKLANHQAEIESINSQTSRAETGIDVMSRVMDALDSRFNGEKKPFLSTGYAEIDEFLGGGLHNHLVVVGGNPGHGKTTLTTNIIENLLVDGVKCAIYSYEMTSDRLVEKMLSSISRVGFKTIRSGKVEDHEWGRLTCGLAKFSAGLKNLTVDNSSGKTINQIAAQIRADYSKGARVFMIDHAQMIPPADSKMDDNSNTKHILNTLTGLKNRLDGACFILISPCRKADSRRADKRPQMDDLFGSRAVSGDADVVLVVYRDEVSDPDSEQKGTMEVIVRKNRDGEVGGTIRLQSNLHFCRFDSFNTDTARF